jgi:hypothetical protein
MAIPGRKCKNQAESGQKYFIHDRIEEKHIDWYLAQPAILRDPKVRELLREVCRELEASDGEKSQ